MIIGKVIAKVEIDSYYNKREGPQRSSKNIKFERKATIYEHEGNTQCYKHLKSRKFGSGSCTQL